MSDNQQQRCLKRKIQTGKSQSNNITTPITINNTISSSTASKENNSFVKTVGSPNHERESQRKSRTRPKPVFFWSNADVIKWLRRCCQEYHSLYAPYFFEHDITGRSLVRMTDMTLEKMGISDRLHREELCTEILKLKLKSDIVEMKDLEKKKGLCYSPSYSGLSPGIEFNSVGTS